MFRLKNRTLTNSNDAKNLSRFLTVASGNPAPNPQYTQVYRVSHFNPTGIVLTAFVSCFTKKVFL